MMRIIYLTLCLANAIFMLSCGNCNNQEITTSKSLQELKESFIEKRFGMFICFNIMSYGASWGEANYPIESFNPKQLNANQWADLAVKAGMKYGLLTTKHHEGFCLWDSKYTEYDVASTPYQKDIVKQYVDAFRKRDLAVGLYFSIWDSTNGIDVNSITPEKMELVKGQITELLTKYGKIDYFVTDGWFWRMGHKDEVPYSEIRNLIKKLQPECLITDHTHLQAPYHLDIPYYEGPFGAFPPKGNQMASTLGHCSIQGNGWFWNEKTPFEVKENDGLDTILSKLKDCESRYCNFMLNCMPNRSGLLDSIYINLLTEIGQTWQLDSIRPKLSDQGTLLSVSFPIKSIKASSGKSEYLFESRQNGTNHLEWESDTNLPQDIIIDMGKEYSEVDMLTIVHSHRSKPYPEMALTNGNIMSCNTYTSTDNINYNLVKSDSWKQMSPYRTIKFDSHKLRYLRIEILKVNGSKTIINDVEVGESD